MKYMVAGHEAFDTSEFAELALGVDHQLFAGVPGESEIDRTARLDAARDMLVDLADEDPELAAYARLVMRQAPVPLRHPAMARRRAFRTGVAA
ncbi:hypothetical protein [Streptacidiphilus sp. MAP5-3]|uniref:hypothetical protein n=1 Tax=unclassified Streptacidiphilus TaxID=2643834 RepID=UPI0035129DB1